MLDISSSEKVDEFERALASYRQAIESGLVIHTAFVSMRASQEIDDLREYLLVPFPIFAHDS